jgi:hypothetical protein
MKIHYERSGGFAGLIKKATIDTDQLPSQSASEIHKLVQKVDFKSFKNKGDHPQNPDAFNYQITIENQNAKSTANFNESEISLNPGVAELIDKLKDYSDQIT